MRKRKKTVDDSPQMKKTAEAFRKYLIVTPLNPQTSNKPTQPPFFIRKNIQLWIPNKKAKNYTSSNSFTGPNGKYVTIDNRIRLIKFNDQVYYHGTLSRESSVIKHRSKTQKMDKLLFNYDDDEDCHANEARFGAIIPIFEKQNESEVSETDDDDNDDDDDDDSMSSSMMEFTDETEIENDNEMHYVYNKNQQEGRKRTIVGIRFIPSNYQHNDMLNADEDVAELVKYKAYKYL